MVSGLYLTVLMLRREGEVLCVFLASHCYICVLESTEEVPRIMQNGRAQ